MLRSSLPRLLSPIAVALWILASSLSAGAQTAPVTPYFAATTRADVPLKSGDMDGYYHVAILPEGQVLQVDAEGGGWARVSYPPGIPVYVGAAEVTVEPGTSVAVLTRVSALKSRNASAGFAQSWQRAVPRGSELAAGARLEIIEEVSGPDGRAIGYVVEAPEEARGYVKAETLRVATQAEIDAYRATLSQQGRPAPEQDGEQGRPEPAPAPERPEPAPQDAPTEQETDESLLEPMHPSGQPVPEDQGDQPLDEALTPQDQPGVQGESAETPEDITVINQGDASPEARQLATLQSLQDAFNEVQGQPSESAELDELAAEFRRTIASLGDTPADQRIRESLRQRLDFIELRITFRDTARELAAKSEAIDARAQAVRARVQELESTRGYQFVGRLVRSSVYDGERLPLMYRIVSVNESMPRTIGYIKPGEESLGAETKLGEIVGVLGTSTLDEALQLRIVSPSRIDVLQAESVGAPGETAPVTAGERAGSDD